MTIIVKRRHLLTDKFLVVSNYLHIGKKIIFLFPPDKKRIKLILLVMLNIITSEANPHLSQVGHLIDDACCCRQIYSWSIYNMNNNAQLYDVVIFQNGWQVNTIPRHFVFITYIIYHFHYKYDTILWILLMLHLQHHIFLTRFITLF